VPSIAKSTRDTLPEGAETAHVTLPETVWSFEGETVVTEMFPPAPAVIGIDSATRSRSGRRREKRSMSEVADFIRRVYRRAGGELESDPSVGGLAITRYGISTFRLIDPQAHLIRNAFDSPSVQLRLKTEESSVPDRPSRPGVRVPIRGMCGVPAQSQHLP
jgi:hypothetical protein